MRLKGRRCWGDRIDLCTTPRAHRFEIYYPTGLFPKEQDLRYFHAATLPSAMLLSMQDKESIHAAKTTRDKPRIGAIDPFEARAFGVLALQPNDQLSIGFVRTEIYFQSVFEGLDYLALDMVTGFGHTDNWKSNPSRDLLIVAKKLGDRRSYYKIPRNEFAAQISLPQRMADAVIRNDLSPRNSLKELVNKALSPGNSGQPAK